MTGYFIDSAFGYISWTILILIIGGGIKLFKKEKFKTINLKAVFLISLIGVISPTLNLLSGKYQNKTAIKMTETDKLALKEIIQSCLSGKEITKITHDEFYNLVSKNKMNQEDINEMFSVFYNDDMILLQKSFYNDALKTVQTGKIYESETRLNLEKKLLNDSQKERNMVYLQKILSKDSIDVNGVKVVIDAESCLSVINNFETSFKVGRQNISTLKNRDAFK